MQNTKEEFEKYAKIAKITAAIDALLAFICAASGSFYFVWFMILAGWMWALGIHQQAKANNLQGE